MKVLCPYCGAAAEEVGGDVIYPHRRDLASKRFWRCAPCDSSIGCRPGTSEPLGRLANAELRMAKRAAHDAFDPLWKTRKGSKAKKVQARAQAYAWLARTLGVSECHIGSMDVADCRRVIEACAMMKEGTPT